MKIAKTGYRKARLIRPFVEIRSDPSISYAYVTVLGPTALRSAASRKSVGSHVI